MSFLDLYQQDARDATAMQPGEQTQLPATFSEGFDAAWRENQLFRQSISGETARQQALQDHIDDVQRRTGHDLAKDIDYSASAFGGALTADMLREQVNIAARKAGQPELDAGALDQAAIAKARTARADYATMAGREKTGGGTAGFILGNLAGAATDPINVLALPVAPAEGLSILATGLRWAAIGGVSQAAIEVASADFHEKVQPGYAESGEPLLNIAEAAGGAAALGGGLRAAGNAWTRLKTGQWPRSIRDAGNIVESEANVAQTNIFPGLEGEAAHRSALQESIENLINGRPIAVDQHVTPSILAAYEGRLAPVMDARARAVAAGESAIAIEREGARLPPTMERLTELQLAEIRQSHAAVGAEAGQARTALAGEAQSIEAARGPLAEQQAAVAAQRADVEKLRGEVAAAQERAGAARPAIDETTTARLAAIEEDLAAPALSSGRRAELSAERATITQTLAKTAKEDSRAAASLAQEQKALEKALARQERALTKAEASAQRAEQKLAAQAERLPQRQEAVEARATSRRETVSNEMRRTVARLAEDGYGVRLSREEAQALADKALTASDGDVEAALRNVTETLVDRRIAQQRAAPELPGFEKPSPVEQQKSRAGYWTEEMRKGVTALAREVGYEMPREEAASIAAALAKAPEHEALAILDETMLRPRTITENLPGAVSARMKAVEERKIRTRADADTDPAFRKFFQGSKAVDENGKPLALFHGTSLKPTEKPFMAFDRARLGEATDAPSAKEAFFFTEDPELSQSYGASSSVYEEFAPLRFINRLTGGAYEKFNETILNAFGQSAKREGHVVTAHVSAKRPLEVDLAGQEYREESFFDTIRRAKEAGHDSVLFKNAVDPGFVEGMGGKPANIWAVFEPDQIRIRSFNKSDEVLAAGGMEPPKRPVAPPAPLAPAHVERATEAALSREMTPAALEKLRAEPELDDSILRDLDRLRAEKGDVEIPMGEQINAAGERVAVSRKIESVLAEADDRLAASREIAACVGPQQEAAE